jgi:acetyl esterase/lipase
MVRRIYRPTTRGSIEIVLREPAHQAQHFDRPPRCDSSNCSLRNSRFTSLTGIGMRVTLAVVGALCVALWPLDAADAQQVVRIWPGVAPGSERWTQKEVTYENTPVGTVVMNVVTPTLTAYLPSPDKATGTGIIIAPGGAFVALAMSLEGADLARWLQERGIAAFVLKYRVVEKKQEGIPEMNMDTAGRYGIADGIQALAVVRRRAGEWHVAPNRIGMIGFSAGGMVAAAAALQSDSARRPNFAAMIYGAPFGAMPTIPRHPPPLFLAWAKDDKVALQPILHFRDALVTAGVKPEMHEFNAGGHGFGMKKQGTDSDQWTGLFYQWLERLGLTQPGR